MCRLIVHGDDFGQSRAINEGIARAHREGILTSASIMAPGVAFEHAIGLWRENPSLDLGVHLTLLEEAPVTPVESVPTLIDRNGRFRRHHMGFARAYLLGRISPAEVRRELRAQISKAIDGGLPISHLDSHQHLHMVPGIRSIVVELARTFDIRAIRFPRERIRWYMAVRLHRLPRLGQMMALNAVCALSRRTTVATTDHFVGFFDGGRLSTRSLKRVLAHLPRTGTCELACHPGIADSAEGRMTGAYVRSNELHALCDPDIAEMVRARGIQLVSFRDV
jgi:hopanoid biosynthesis associated protein HpnK